MTFATCLSCGCCHYKILFVKEADKTETVNQVRWLKR